MRYAFFFLFLSLALFADQREFAVGKEIFQKSCVVCHAEDGSANVEQKLVVMPRDLTRSILYEEQSYKIIKYGSKHWGSVADIMPSFQEMYNEYELHAVAHYISSAFHPNTKQRIEKLYKESLKLTQEQKEKMFQRGKKIYKRNCSWCHGETGEGDGEATRNPEKSIYPYNLRKTLLDEKQIFLYAKYGGRYFGTHKNDMPNWSRKYDDFTLKSVAHYIVEALQK